MLSGFRVAPQCLHDTTTSTAHTLFLRVFLPATVAVLSFLFFLHACMWVSPVSTAVSCATTTVLTFATAHGISMTIGRRRPSLHRGRSSSPTPILHHSLHLRAIQDWRLEPNVHVVKMHQRWRLDRLDWSSYPRSPPHNVAVVWQVLL